MTSTFTTNAAIEALVAAQFPAGASAREMHIYRENLRALVRLARLESNISASKFGQLPAGSLMVMENVPFGLAA
jgi:hypothetical protein